MSTDKSAQELFDEKYITGHEIRTRLRISSSALVQAHKRRLLPAPIKVGDNALYLWERSITEPFLNAWELTLKVRRKEVMA